MGACGIPEQQLWSWVDRDAPELHNHVAACEACRQRADAFQRAIRVLTQEAVHFPARQIGVYTLKRMIGEGAQGIVYEAEQRTPRRRVAIKLLRAGGEPSQQHRWFARETESLGRLRHPNIAAIYDAGPADDGWLYIAMELVEGQPLTAFARDAELSRAARLRLLLRVCDAVVYAHQRGVIHRDLKPSNIIVDTLGQPRVLDFGLARLTDPDAACSRTLGGAVLGTVPYLSPEQAGGNTHDSDMRSDVYALGVLMFELITGRLPLDVPLDRPIEALRLVCEQAPQSPSSIVPGLCADLDTIALKALAKEPDQRYASVAEFAEDIERYLRHEPIRARRPSAWYQLRKLCRRRRGPVLLISAAVFCVLGLGGFSAWRATQEHAARVQAQAAEALASRSAWRAQRVGAFLEALLSAGDPRWSGPDAPAPRILESAEAQLADYSGGDALLEAALRSVLGRVCGEFGFLERGQAHLAQALTLYEDILPPDDAQIAAACHDLALTMFGEGDRELAAMLLERALRLREVRGSAAELNETRTALASLHGLQGRHDQALALRTAVVAARRGGDPALLAEALGALGATLAELDRPLAASGAHNEALVLLRSLVGPRHRALGLALLAAARSAQRGNDLGSAEQLLLEAQAIFTALPGETPNLLLSLQHHAELAVRCGRLETAIDTLSRALDLCDSTFPPWHYIPLSCRRQLGACLSRCGRFDDAQAALAASLDGYRRLQGPEGASVRRLQEQLRTVERRQPLPVEAAGAYP